MARIKINDLPKDMKISKEEMKKVVGGNLEGGSYIEADELSHLELQQKMQEESRQYTTISNVMKTKHDTEKNAINNVR